MFLGNGPGHCSIDCFFIFFSPPPNTTKTKVSATFSSQDAPSEHRDAPSELQDVPSEPQDSPIEILDVPSEPQDSPIEILEAPSEPPRRFCTPRLGWSKRFPEFLKIKISSRKTLKNQCFFVFFIFHFLFSSSWNSEKAKKALFL